MVRPEKDVAAARATWLCGAPGPSPNVCDPVVNRKTAKAMGLTVPEILQAASGTPTARATMSATPPGT